MSEELRSFGKAFHGYSNSLETIAYAQEQARMHRELAANQELIIKNASSERDEYVEELRRHLTPEAFAKLTEVTP